MAELVLAAAGSAIGASIGGAFLGVSAASWGWIAGSLLGSALFPQKTQGPRLDDRTIVGTEYGQAIPWVAGSPRLAGQYIWASPLREIANTQRAGKGGGAKVTTYTYECDVMIILSENVTEGVARDWLNGELVRNGVTIKDGIWNGVTVYTGAADQLPDPTYEAAVGAGNAPAYRGRTTIVIRGLQLGGGKQLPNLEHQISSAVIVPAPKVFSAPLADDLSDKIAPPLIEQMSFGSGVTLNYSADSVVISRPSYELDAELVWRTDDFGGKIDNTNYLDGKITYAFDLIDYVSVAGTGINEALGFYFGVDSPGTGNNFSFLVRVSPEGSVFAITSVYGQTIGTAVPITSPKGTFKIEMDMVGETIKFIFNDVVLRTEPGYSYGITRIRFILERSSGIVRYSMSSVTLANFRAWIGGYLDEAIVYPGQAVLGETIRALLDRSGYFPSEYQVSSALDEVGYAGYATGQVASTRTDLETLRPFGLYEANCSDKLYIFPRSREPVGAVLWSDLGASESPDAFEEPFDLKLANEREMPAQIAVRYKNATADGNVGTEFSDRLVSSMVSTQVAEMAITMTPAQAKSVADTMLKDLMAGLGRATLKLGGRKYARYEPGDVLTTTDPDGRVWRFRILTKRDLLIMLEWDVVIDDASALDTPAITYEGYVSTENPVRVAPTEAEFLALPPLRDADATSPGAYVAATPAKTSASDEWPGCVVVRARLPEAFEQQFTTGDACVMGTCLTTLGNFPRGSGVLDNSQALRVRVRGELASSNWADFHADRTVNAALVGYEPIRFMTATFVELDGVHRVYDLTGLLRGQLGQEHQIAGHVAGERFVLLNGAIRRMTSETTDIGQEHQVKAVTLNTLLSSVTDEPFTDDGIALRPYSPVYLQALAQLSGDLAVSWVRRSRLVARYTDAGVFAPLGEASEAYRIKVFDGATQVRTVDVTTPAWTYAAADIAADGFASGDPITITVQQLSDAVGEGFAATVETTAP